jgi:AmmeMemoRadiSam system protein A
MSRLSEHAIKPAATPEYSPEERRILLRLAHESISSCLGLQYPSEALQSPHLRENRGVFTTLYVRGNLRGCVGYAVPIAPLFRAVAETARSAAFEDSRFPAITVDEVAELKVSLSVLSPLFDVRPEQVEVGRHGLVVSQGYRRGLLLPQVALEWNWDRETFLAQTCKKAGLPSDAWRLGVQLQAFTAELFGDPDLPQGGTKEKGE